MALVRLADAVVATLPLADPSAEARLTAAERALVDAAPSEKRAQELRAGRAAAHLALAAAAPHHAPTSVLSDREGRPVLDPPGSLHVSLAHDGALAAAAVAPLPVGLDLVALDRAEQVARVVGGRLRSGRAAGLGAQAALPWSEELLLWSAWEALGKRAGSGVLGGAMGQRLALGRHEGLLCARAGGALVRWWQEAGLLVCLATSEEPR